MKQAHRKFRITKNYLSLLLTSTISFLGSSSIYATEFVGSEACAKCHASQYNSFRVSGHPFKLMKAELAKHRPIPLPKGYTWDDISYVIGGAYKKIRFIDKKGYIITAAKDGKPLKTQYNLETGTWAFYHKGEKKPYTCGACHTTGLKKDGNQGGLEGIKGTWAAEGVQCEACHGAGSKHVKSADKKDITLDSSSKLCARCHSRGKSNLILAKKGFIRHHEQFNELLQSPHKYMSCNSCHDPHKKAQFSIKKDCSGCHQKQAAAFKGSTMEKVGVNCIDCHMPRATKSAVAFGQYEGDIRTHLFKINSNTKTSMFYKEDKNGKTLEYAKSFVTVDFACLACHKNQDMAWAGKNAKGIH